MKFAFRTTYLAIIGTIVLFSPIIAKAEANEFNKGAGTFVKTLANDAITNLTANALTDLQRQENCGASSNLILTLTALKVGAGSALAKSECNGKIRVSRII